MRHYVAPLIYHWVQSLAAMREVIMDSLQRATNTILYKIPYQHNIVHSWYSTESKWPGLAPVILCADFAPSLCGWCAWHSYDNYATYRSPQRAQCVSSCAVLIVYVFLVVRNLAKKYTFKLYHIHESVRTPYRRSKRSMVNVETGSLIKYAVHSWDVILVVNLIDQRRDAHHVQHAMCVWKPESVTKRYGILGKVATIVCALGNNYLIDICRISIAKPVLVLLYTSK